MSRPSHDSASRALFEHPLILESLVLGFAHSAVGDQLDMSTLKRIAARHVSDGADSDEKGQQSEGKGSAFWPKRITVLTKRVSSERSDANGS